MINSNEIDRSEFDVKGKRYPNVSILQFDEKVTLGECLNLGIKKAKYSYIAKFDDDDYYSPFYLQEAYHAIKLTSAKVIGKYSIYIYFLKDRLLCEYYKKYQNIFLQSNDVLQGATLVINKEILTKLEFPHVNIGEDLGFQQLCKKSGISLYSTSKYNYTYIRYEQKGHHSSDVTSSRLKRRCKHIFQTNDFQPYVDREFE